MSAFSIIDGSVTADEIASAYYINLDISALSVEINKLVRNAEHHASAAGASAMLAGSLLTRAKAMVPHGEWESWVANNCTIALRTVQAYMRLHDKLIKLPASEAQRVALLPLRDAIKAISTPATAPPRYSSWHRPSKDRRERAADALSKAADAQRKLVRNVNSNFVKRAQVDSVRTKLQAALAALDDLQVDGEVQQ
jgi:hypothetical protein